MSGLSPASLRPAALLARGGCGGEPALIALDSPQGLEIHAALYRDVDEGLALLRGAVPDEEVEIFISLLVIASVRLRGYVPPVDVSSREQW